MMPFEENWPRNAAARSGGGSMENSQELFARCSQSLQEATVCTVAPFGADGLTGKLLETEKRRHKGRPCLRP